MNSKVRFRHQQGSLLASISHISPLTGQKPTTPPTPIKNLTQKKAIKKLIYGVLES